MKPHDGAARVNDQGGIAQPCTRTGPWDGERAGSELSGTTGALLFERTVSAKEPASAGDPLEQRPWEEEEAHPRRKG
jgi:hypothetical protein